MRKMKAASNNDADWELKMAFVRLDFPPSQRDTAEKCGGCVWPSHRTGFSAPSPSAHAWGNYELVGVIRND